MKDFLTARWSNIILLTYRVEPELLHPYLPRGCELDTFEGVEGFVSLVAFDFLDTRVKGIGWPLPRSIRNFPEINLRFYVRHQSAEGPQRGVCFIREFVPSRLVAGVARWVYNEPYRATRMTSETRDLGTDLHITHHLHWAGTENHLEVQLSKQPTMPAPDSPEHFFKEHQWGFGKDRRGQLLRYQVIHPEWQTYPLLSYKLNWNWAATYGNKWAILQEATPFHTMVAAGSNVRVLPIN